MKLNRKAIMNIVRTRLSDSLWQGLSGVFGLLSLIITILTAPWFAKSMEKELTITSIGIIVPTFSKGVDITFLADGNAFTNISWSVLTIRNSGSSSIKPEDFFKPLSVELTDNALSLLAVFQTDMITTDVTNADDALRIRKSIRPWKRDGTRFLMEPQLLNPGDESVVVLVSGNNSMAPDAFYEKYILRESEQKPAAVFSTRIADLKELKFVNPEKYFGYVKSRISLGYKYLITDLIGSYVYYFLILATILTFFTQLLVMFTHPFSRHTWVNAAMSILGILLSVITSEILVSASAYGIFSQVIPGTLIISIFSCYVFVIIRYRLQQA